MPTRININRRGGSFLFQQLGSMINGSIYSNRTGSTSEFEIATVLLSWFCLLLVQSVVNMILEKHRDNFQLLTISPKPEKAPKKVRVHTNNISIQLLMRRQIVTQRAKRGSTAKSAPFSL